MQLLGRNLWSVIKEYCGVVLQADTPFPKFASTSRGRLRNKLYSWAVSWIVFWQCWATFSSVKIYFYDFFTSKILYFSSKGFVKFVIVKRLRQLGTCGIMGGCFRRAQWWIKQKPDSDTTSNRTTNRSKYPLINYWQAQTLSLNMRYVPASDTDNNGGDSSAPCRYCELLCLSYLCHHCSAESQIYCINYNISIVLMV